MLIVETLHSHHLPSMKRRNKQNIIPLFNLILVLPFQLPIRIINKDQYTRPPVIAVSQRKTELHKSALSHDQEYAHGIIKNEQLLPWILHHRIAQMPH